MKGREDNENRGAEALAADGSPACIEALKADRRTRATERMAAERIIHTGVCRSEKDVPHPPT